MLARSFSARCATGGHTLEETRVSCVAHPLGIRPLRLPKVVDAGDVGVAVIEVAVAVHPGSEEAAGGNGSGSKRGVGPGLGLVDLDALIDGEPGGASEDGQDGEDRQAERTQQQGE